MVGSYEGDVVGDASMPSFVEEMSEYVVDPASSSPPAKIEAIGMSHRQPIPGIP
jgi:hypothetical protein